MAIGCLNTAAAQEDNLREEVVAALEQFLAGASINDPEVHDDFWAEELTYTSSSGHRYGKAQLMEGVRSAETPGADGDADADIIWYYAENIELKPLGEAVIVNFTLGAEADHKPESPGRRFLNTGVLIKRDGRWQAINWNATAAADTAD
ncbi:hypothetical protein IDSA_08710 [Pseudidiomarina salinarum]|uniref:DUF4440 domain-containing protein n=2 Tax=Pseudidiomarina salinarum TaxID=435908 RepID=A0A094L759_9GAMM|nr:hypothetical protein IDSA_08710 [Pseudidiomarina salinarum]